jgi:hypothetical protein
MTVDLGDSRQFPDNSLLLRRFCEFWAEIRDWRIESKKFPAKFPVISGSREFGPKKANAGRCRPGAPLTR